jgi:tRNA A37 threonylcarbamoyladenosine dehydratase
MEWNSRTELLLEKEGLAKLQRAHVLVVGLGGVGAYAAEMLVRAGIGEITIIDGDVVQPSNRNRQLAALCSTQYKPKVEVMIDRLLDINPDLIIHPMHIFLTGEVMPELLQTKFDYVVDAIDSISPKVFLIVHTMNAKYPLISSMGAGGKFDPAKVVVDDISKSYHCKLARMIRKRLTKFDVKTGFDVVYSPESVKKEHVIFVEGERNKKTTVGTISYMPALFGLYAASKVIRELTGR